MEARAELVMDGEAAGVKRVSMPMVLYNADAEVVCIAVVVNVVAAESIVTVVAVVAVAAAVAVVAKVMLVVVVVAERIAMFENIAVVGSMIDYDTSEIDYSHHSLVQKTRYAFREHTVAVAVLHIAAAL